MNELRAPAHGRRLRVRGDRATLDLRLVRRGVGPGTHVEPEISADPDVLGAARKLDWRPSAPTLELVDAARDVLAEAGGYSMTLRAVYYRLVAKNRIENSPPSYKRLSELLDRARWAGLLDRDSMEDVERRLTEWQTHDNPVAAIRDLADGYATDWWAGAAYRLEVWAEKRSVAGIMEPEAARFQCPFMAARGFASLTALADLAYRSRTSPVLILYAGDFDPSGLAMDRDLQGRIAALGGHAVLRRIALTKSQIEEHDLPPQPTKSTDSRARGYAHGGSWELDALPPAELAGIVRSAISEHLPPDLEARRDADADVTARLHRVASRLEAGE